VALADEIQSAVKSKNAIIGFRESMKAIRAGTVKAVIVANNIPSDMDSEIKHNARVANAKLETFDGGSKDLGTACGKPFPVSVMVIKE
jgi:large subunit ribosomal protein L30e